MLDFENLPAYMDYLAGSVMLSPEQRAAVQSSLVILKHQMKFSHLCFWGRIHGSLKDYYIVQGVEGIDWYNRRTLFSQVYLSYFLLVFYVAYSSGGSVAEWLACWTQAQKARVQVAVATLSGNSLRQTAHTHCASVHQAAKLVAALFLRVAWVTAGLAECNGSLLPGL